jgi:toxin ParE1/3/4
LPNVRLSSLAQADLLSIAEYTLKTWGPTQTVHYLAELEDCRDRLAANPSLGRPCDHIRPGLRRIEQGKHVIFYESQARGILITRILYRNMLPGRNPMGE